MLRRALLSVTDKTGLEDLANTISEICPGIEFIASGGTAKYLKEHGHKVTSVESYTGQAPFFQGRVKTLHPKIAGGILYRRGVDEEEAKQLDISPIDLVVCNLYAFDKRPVLEEIDIGGSTLMRSAAKNHESVCILVSPNQYIPFVEELKECSGTISKESRQALAVEAFNHSVDYDVNVATHLCRQYLKEEQRRPKLIQGETLRYGENPDQKGWIYRLEDCMGVAQGTLLSGKALSYNNYEDATAAYHACQDLGLFDAAAAAVIKHGSLCGLATGKTVEDAFSLAWEGDSKSAYGSVVAINQEATEDLIPCVRDKFFEVLLAPAFSSSFIQWMTEKKPACRVLEVPTAAEESPSIKGISGGILVQSKKRKLHRRDLPAVSKKPLEKGLEDLAFFSIAAVKHSKSNAVVLSREVSANCYQLIGVGSGQPNRIDSLERLAIPKALKNTGGDLGRSILASDGFFPFADSVHSAARAGVKVCIQPGGAKRDQEVIDAADEADMCMIFTGERYFSH